jgi:putative sugar O-methyltransferase
MMAYLEHGDATYEPSRFWRDLARENLRMVDAYGATRFKRSVSQNYFNWPIQSVEDPQMRVLLQHWANAPTSRPLEVSLNGSAELEGVARTIYVNTPAAARVYTLFVGLLWWYVTKDWPDDLPSRLEEPALGEPVDLRLESGQRISQDLANSLKEWGRIAPFLSGPGASERPILAELGAGYGRLGHLARTASGCRYWVFDIAPALALAEWYLPSVFPGARLFHWRPISRWADVAEEVGDADLAFFTVDQLGLLPQESVDVFAAISVLHEMRPDRAKFFLDLMAQKTVAALYTKNWTVWDNVWDGVEFRSEMLTEPRGMETVFERPDDTIEAFTEKLFRRTAAPGDRASAGS